MVTSLAAFSPVTSPPPRKHVRSRSYECLNLPTFCLGVWARCIELYTDWYLTFEADICFFHFHFIWSGHAGFWVWGRRNWTMVLVCLFGLLYQLQEEISGKRNNATTQNKLHFYCHVVWRITWKQRTTIKDKKQTALHFVVSQNMSDIGPPTTTDSTCCSAAEPL